MGEYAIRRQEIEDIIQKVSAMTKQPKKEEEQKKDTSCNIDGRENHFQK